MSPFLLDENLIFLLALVALLSPILLIRRYQTVLLGFAVLSFVNLFRSSLSSFVFGHLFGANTYIGQDYLWVYTYSALGLIAYVIGVGLAWRPLQKEPTAPILYQTQAWLNARFAILCMAIGGISFFMAPIMYRIPTVTAIWGNYFQFLNLGVLLACLHGIVQKKQRIIFNSLVVYAIYTIIYAVQGHVFANGVFALQLLIVLCFWKRPNLYALALFSIGLLLILSLLIGWLDSRYLIRQGHLNQYTNSYTRATAFLNNFHFVNPLQIDSVEVQAKIQDRLDFSPYLAAQVRMQPNYVPYAYGGTVFPELVQVLIPRILWSGKTFQTGSSDAIMRYSGIPIALGTSVDMIYQFEFYANGGFIGVITGLFLLGWLTAKLELQLFIKKLSLTYFLSIFGILFAIVTGEKRIVLVVLTAISSVAGAIVIVRGLELLNMTKQLWQADSPVVEKTPLPGSPNWRKAV